MEDIVRKETMTSLEIAEVTGKQHAHIMRDIRKLLEQGVSESNFGLTSYRQAQPNGGSKDLPMYQLTKKGCLILASGYDALLREKIINRWEELENQVRKSEIVMPNFSNPAEAARAWAEQFERNLALEANNKELKEENQTLAPKGEYFDDLVARNLLTNFTKVAHQLNIKRKTFIEWLIRDKFIYRDHKNKLVPYAKYAHTYFHINDTKGKYSKWAGNQTLITPEGKEAFRLLYERRGEKLLEFEK